MHDHRGVYVGTLQFVPPENAEQITRERDEALKALELMAKHYDDLCKSNPGWMGKMCLQDYELWNKSLLAMEVALAKAGIKV